MSRLTASRAALDLIASFEGFRARAAKTPDGRWTLGFGHIATAREGLTVSRAEAEDLLRWDLRPVEDLVRQSALTPLNQNQFDALVSFAFNIGLSNYAKSDVLRYLNQGQPIAAALAMHAWRRAKVNGGVLVIDALVRRRAAEAALFLEPLGPRPAAPSSVLSPEIDYAAALLSHASDPREVTMAIAADGATIATDSTPQAALRDSEAVGLTSSSERAGVVKAEVVTEPVLSSAAPSAEALLHSEEATGGSAPGSSDNAEMPASPALQATTATFATPQLEPFAKEVALEAANSSDQSQPVAANDAPLGLAPWAPELETGAEIAKGGTVELSPASTLEPAAPTSGFTWGFLALGAVLLAGGLWYAHLIGALTPDPEGKDISIQAIIALVSAALGFVMLVTSAVSLARGQESGDETALLP